MRGRYVCLLAVGAFLVSPASGQDAPPANVAAPPLPDGGSSDEIIVRALKIPRTKLPVNVHWAPYGNVTANIAYERADQFLSCAFKKVRRDWLRKAVEGPPHLASTVYAQGLVTVTNLGCYPPPGSTAAPDVMAAGASYLDRTILLEQVLRRFVPNAALDAAQTFDPAVRARFRVVETQHNRYRRNPELSGFALAACLVQTQPVLATRLVHAEQGSDLVRGLEQAMIVNAPECLQGLTRLTVEPTTTRMYIVDAFYRWLLAVRNVPTLIPASNA
ncbi:hypothetical protein [Sphingomonas fuzhouensis]|uniref:hypothetical protein n=1 Tax=Sphingomonas fuzhouensis TaxID=3106033 RepID=UPI002AFEFA02|nr:hypothetical protein [Sphingomonas sp. SGZ-02]